MASAYALSDLVVCRSGALTISEVTTCGKPSILIPFAAAAGNHQMRNAETLYQAGASIIIKEKDLSSEKLFNNVNYLINNENTLKKMSVAAKTLSKPDATKEITDHVIDMVSNV